MFDLLIRGGLLLDGSGAPAVRADIGLSAGSIADIGRLQGRRAAHSIDAFDLMVAPGFIDIHAHDDFNLPVNPGAAGKVLQGVTTTVVGNCGWSPAPVLPEHRQDYVALASFLDSGLSWDWQNFAGYMNSVPPLAVNACQLVGHVAVRTAVMGVDNRTPDDNELKHMQTLIAEAMQAGAIGFSTGLTYTPSCFADTAEIIELARVAAQYGGIYATHHRGPDVFEAVAEAIAIGRASGAAVQISHLKLARTTQWGQTQQLMALLDAARNSGVDVLCDQYPYLAGSSGLKNHIPHWAQEGGDAVLLARLRDPAICARLTREIENAMAAGEHVLSGWNKVAIAWSASHPQLAGLTVAAAAGQMNLTPAEAYFQILRDDQASTLCIDYVMDETDVRAIMQHPATMIGSDGIFRGLHGQPDPGRPHPRHFGTFPRILGHYCRELGLLDLPTAIYKMTGQSADRLGLSNRGRIKAGNSADLVLFNPETIQDRATYDDPQQPPAGIELVVNNGVCVAEGGRLSGATPAGMLRREDNRHKTKH
jgi:N-acyl-D-amino-acid deacylase